jgi:iron(III) transport system substrate-binding protein
VLRARRSLLVSGILPGLIAAGSLTGCSSGSGGNSITLYSGQHEQTTDKLIAGFEKATGIDVRVRFNDEDALDNQIQAEGSHSPADVFFTENTMPLEDLDSHHLLAPVDPATLAHTPSTYNAPDGHWVGISARVSVLVYNPSKISAAALPKTVLAMADPAYRGKLAIAPGETDFQPIVTSVLRSYGEARTTQWLKGIKANAGDAHTYPDNETVVNDVNKGLVAFGLINQYYWYRLAAEIGTPKIHSAIAYFAPRDPGYVLNVSGAAVLASSAHKSAAEKFVAYLTSRAGQQIIAHSISFEYPIASGVKTVAKETPLAQLKPAPISLTQLGTGHTAIDLLHRAQLL